MVQLRGVVPEHGMHMQQTSLARDGIFTIRLGVSSTRVILDFHSKSPDLVTIIFDLSEVTVPDE